MNVQLCARLIRSTQDDRAHFRPSVCRDRGQGRVARLRKAVAHAAGQTSPGMGMQRFKFLSPRMDVAVYL